jgi:hypothetical protein
VLPEDGGPSAPFLPPVPEKCGISSDSASLIKTPSALLTLFHSAFSSFEASTIITAIAWNIWKRRNNLVFNSDDEALPVVIRSCLADIKLWASRWCISFEPP